MGGCIAGEMSSSYLHDLQVIQMEMMRWQVEFGARAQERKNMDRTIASGEILVEILVPN